jgi:hypothetical protein
MSSSPTLPVFQEGQILSAASLTAMVDYARGQLARHERYLHDWGIAAGLALTANPNTDSNGNSFADVSLSPGVAIDGYGAEIIVPAPYALDYNDFQSQKIATSDPKAWYPAFLQGQITTSTSNSSSQGSCNGSQTSQSTLAYSVTFGRPGDESGVLAQVPPSDVTTGAGPNVNGWKILVGFVQWSAAANRFSAAASSSGSSFPKYAGVQADTVRARGSSLTLATQQNPVMLVLDGTNGLQFGLPDPASGQVKAVFTVSPQGDLSIRGTNPVISQFGSGAASDGMLIPLPGGITQAQVDSGAIVLTTHVTPRYQGSRPQGFAPGDWTMVPLECRLDGRRVCCRVRWSNNGSFPLPGGGNSTIDVAGVCDYLVIAAPPVKAGS